MSVTVSRPESPPVQPSSTALPHKRKPRWWKDPWRKPRILETVTWMYLVWSILPVGIAILISFNSGRSISTFQGFGLTWWNQDPDSLFKDPDLHTAIFQTLKLSIITMLVAVPLGVMFAIGIDRWRGRPARGANFVMLLSFVMPEIIIGVAMFLVFQYLFKFIHLGTAAELLGLITFQLSYPVIIVRARLLSIGKEYEEAALDLGARVSLPGGQCRSDPDAVLHDGRHRRRVPSLSALHEGAADRHGRLRGPDVGRSTRRTEVLDQRSPGLRSRVGADRPHVP